MSHNLTRAAGARASGFRARARGATIRAHLINVGARIARHGRGHITAHLPQGWHREHEWLNLRPDPMPPDTATITFGKSPPRKRSLEFTRWIEAQGPRSQSRR